MKLYLPTSSLNFNDILATESISPKAFYSRRTFGTKRNFTTELSSSDFVLTWYTKKPLFNLITGNDTEFEDYPIIIELDYQKGNYRFENIKEQVYLCYKTVYFQPDNVKFLFISKEHIETVIAKSKLVDETKLVEKYKNNLLLIDKNQLTKVSSITIAKPISNIDQYLIYDRTFNHIKGFVYSYISAKIKENKRKKDLSNLYGIVKDAMDRSFSVELLEDIEVIQDLLILAEKHMKRVIEKQSNDLDSLFPIETIKGPRLKLKSYVCEKTDELRAFEVVINTIIQNPKSRVGEVGKEEINILINTLIENINVVFGELSEFTTDLIKVKNKIINRIYDMDIRDIKTDIMKNLLVFLMKYNNLEEFEKFLVSKNIPQKYFSYSFHGAFYGFSGLSRTITYEIDYQDKYLCHLIDSGLNYVKTLLENQNYKGSNGHELMDGDKLVLVEEVTKDKSVTYEKDLFELNNEKEEIEKRIIAEIKRLQKPALLEGYLNSSSPTIIENGAIVNFKRSEQGIKIIINNLNKNFYVSFIEKGKATDTQINNFKKQLKKLKLSTSIPRGKYSIFSYGKSEVPFQYDLDDDELQYLVVCLRLLI